MKRIDNFESMTVDEVAEYIADNWIHDDDPVITWFDKEYCSKCMPIEKDDVDYLWCEVYGKCKHFKELNTYPENKDMVKLWLESKVED